MIAAAYLMEILAASLPTDHQTLPCQNYLIDFISTKESSNVSGGEENVCYAVSASAMKNRNTLKVTASH